MTRLLDAYADVLPYGLHPTPFGEVWRALQLVASTVWDVDPAVYRAGIAWGWYVQRDFDALTAQRDLVIAALISEQAPLIKADQTTAELVEYLRQWREYQPTYDRLEAIYKLFAADVEILPISTPGAPPVSDTRLAFYVRIYGVDFSRLLTLEEAYTIAIRATPLGSRPIVYYEFEEQLSVDTQPLKAGIASITYENDAICEPVELTHYTFIVADATTGQIVSGFSNELAYGEIEGIVLQSPRLVYGVDISVPTAQFWFTDEGRNEQDDSLLPSFGYDIDLYDENGTRANGAQYANAYPLAYMEADGDMFTYGDDRIIINSGADLLGLESDEESNRSAWSVFAERIFTLSFANTQLPGITITMPADETGYKGTSITLPTMSGEYESGGKTWKPSAWDIGAFGDSYTLNADTVAHLVFVEVPQYEEITLYMQSGNKPTQNMITSSFTGDVDSAAVTQLFYDAECTDPFVYDYSSEYVVGRYVDGVWTPRVNRVSDMPSSTTPWLSPAAKGFILYDTGGVWIFTNFSGDWLYNGDPITVRIYPKGQQYYAAYFSQTNIYENYSLANGSTRTGVQRPSSTQFIQTPHQFPTITLQKVLGSAGNEITGNLSVNQGADSTRFTLNNNTGATANVRLAVYTLEYPTYYAWVNLTGDTNVSSGVPYFLMDKDGNYVEYDGNFEYYPIALIKYNGTFSSSDYGYLNRATLQEYAQVPGFLCFIETHGDTSLSKVWYYKKPKPIEVNFGDPVTIPAGYHVESVKCERLYARATSVSSEVIPAAPATSYVYYEFSGENLYCDDTSLSLVGRGVNPCLAIFDTAFNSGAGYHVSYKQDVTPTMSIIESVAEQLNSSGYFIKGRVAVYNNNDDDDALIAGFRSFPSLFRKYIDNTIVPYYFKIQQSLWQFQNGVFSWLGDTTDLSDLAYWYNGLAVQIILAKD